MAGFGNFQVGDCFAQIQEYLAGRVIPTANMAGWVRRTVLELSRDYSFQGLQATGPAVNLIPGQVQYSTDYFVNVADAGLDVSRIESIFMYYNPALTPSMISSGSNTGVTLKYKNIQGLENAMSITSIPSYWSRWQGQLYIGPRPQLGYLTYARYQKQHPFPNAGGANAGNDVILLDDDWQDIVEYASAHRGAISLRLLDYAESFQRILYGDPKWQASGGKDGQPGLIFRRVSQRERDSVTASRSIKVRR